VRLDRIGQDVEKLDAHDEACLSAGNAIAHGGNAKYDATLYDGGRKDIITIVLLLGSLNMARYG
jgi:hypothetical protein